MPGLQGAICKFLWKLVDFLSSHSSTYTLPCVLVDPGSLATLRYMSSLIHTSLWKAAWGSGKAKHFAQGHPSGRVEVEKSLRPYPVWSQSYLTPSLDRGRVHESDFLSLNHLHTRCVTFGRTESPSVSVSSLESSLLSSLPHGLSNIFNTRVINEIT